MARPRKRKTPEPKPKPEPTEPSGLTYRQRLFVVYYLGEANGNATEAARQAGYACPNSVASALLLNPGIAAAVAAKLDRAAMTADEVLARLSEIATADAGDFLKFDGRGRYSLDLKGAKERGKLHLIKAIRPTKFGPAIEIHDAHAALEKLGRYHGLFAEKAVVPSSETQAIRDFLKDEPGAATEGEEAG